MATLSTLLLALTLMVYANAEVDVYQEIIEINARLGMDSVCAIKIGDYSVNILAL